MIMPLIIRILFLFASLASVASIKDDGTSILIDLLQEKNSQTLMTHALLSLREEHIFVEMHRRLQNAGSSKTYASSSNGQRDLKPDSTKSAKSKSAKASQCGCETYEAELAALKEEMKKPEWLFVQVADKCTLDMSGDTPTIESATFHPDTEWFSDRPFQFENTQLTQDWFANFNEMFSDENGFPNAAMTLVNDDQSMVHGGSS